MADTLLQPCWTLTACFHQLSIIYCFLSLLLLMRTRTGRKWEENFPSFFFLRFQTPDNSKPKAPFFTMLFTREPFEWIITANFTVFHDDLLTTDCQTIFWWRMWQVLDSLKCYWIQRRRRTVIILLLLSSLPRRPDWAVISLQILKKQTCDASLILWFEQVERNKFTCFRDTLN